MTNSEDSKWLAAMRQCRIVASEKEINHRLINEELNSLLKLVQTGTCGVKVKGNLESLLEYLILNTELDWISWNLNEFEENRPSTLLNVYMECPPDSTLSSLLSAFSKLSTCARQELCLRLLEFYFKQERFVALVAQESSTVVNRGSFEKTISQNLLTSLNALPNKVANNTMGKFSDIFHHEQFFQLLAIQTGDVINVFVGNVRAEKDVSTSFISQMIGLFCFSGKADVFLGTLLPLLMAKCSSDFIWRKIVQKIISGLSERHLQSTVAYIAQKFPWCGCMKWIFNDGILRKNAKLKFILLHKLIFVKHFPEPIVLQNIIGYIADNSKTHNLLAETIKKLLSVWGDSSAIKHVSYEQHKYITQAILICVGHLTKDLLKTHQQDLTAWLAPGMSNHLDSTDSKVRRLGMIVGEAIAERTDLKGENKLEFGYEKDEETKALVKLLTPVLAPPKEYFEELLQNYQDRKQKILTHVKKMEQKTSGSVKSFTASKATFLKVLSGQRNRNSQEEARNDEKEDGRDAAKEEELDSDDEDDIQPYDLSNDTVYRKVKSPTYIRDCMEGLLEKENREKFEVSIGAVKDLITKNPIAAKEVSIELCRILLDMDNVFALDDFTILRLSAITELVVIDAQNVAGYLTHQFYVEEYCLQHRLDILDILTAAAKILSSVERVNLAETSDQKFLPKEIEKAHSAESWREIVDKRIEAKTRRFGKARKKTLPPKENQFGPIAGCFFYPLLAGYDKRIRTMDLMGNDAIVLGRLLYSVGMILYSAINTMAANTMSKSLLEFVLEMRFHPEPYVRQAALFCVSMATITSGKKLSEFDSFEEITEWVNDILYNDSNARTKQLAAQTAMTMSACFSKDMKIGS